ncbi:MAG: hypothetical protein FWJ93_03795 [Micromonosporaceae bacterium]
MLRAFRDRRYADFATAAARLDRLAAATFTEPMEGYVQRMLRIAQQEGRIPAAYAVDPCGPALPTGARLGGGGAAAGDPAAGRENGL